MKKSGFTALALTTDTQLLGKRLNDVRHNFALPEPYKMMNFEKYRNKQSVSIKSESKKGSGLSEFVRLHKDNNIDWTVIPKIKKLSGMKVYAKGIMCREDALLAMKNGVDGIYVSNHGARQLDTTPATIEVLAEIVEEVATYSLAHGCARIPVWFDGGIRNGSDILKALAIGADLVWIGRPVLWALACEGQTGVENMLKILNEQLKEAML